MAEHIKVKAGEIAVGRALPWAVHDASGRLLLQKGSLISSSRQLDILIARGLYRTPGAASEAVSPPAPPDTSSPFEILTDTMQRLSALFSAIILQQGRVAERTRRLCLELQALCETDADAALGAVHLCHDRPYTLSHPIHIAILVELIARRLGTDAEARRPLLAAALSANVSMLELQEILHHQQAPLSDDQRRAIREHPDQSVAMLRGAGIEDALWLDIVHQHHERLDGSGYPRGRRGEALCSEGQLLGLADRYAAMVSARSYRKALPATEALRGFFMEMNKEFDETLTLLFIKELGVFPPGSFVALQNGEIAVVTKRGRDSMWPTVCSILSPRGGPYLKPLRRDCNSEEYAIKDMCFPDKLPPLNPHLIWGYRK